VTSIVSIDGAIFEEEIIAGDINYLMA